MATVNHTPKDNTEAAQRLKITEIFYSLQGEASTVGWPTVFIRLTGCPLRCVYCDTAYAFTGGEWMSYDDIIKKTAEYSPQYITVTGGEPLAQNNCHGLLSLLCDQGYKVSLETSGAIDLSQVDHRVSKVMDIKTPGSKEQARNRWDNLQYINEQDQIKFVIADRSDYEWAKSTIDEYKMIQLTDILFSPVHGLLNSAELAEWILEDRLTVRFQMQLHKHLWGDTPGR